MFTNTAATFDASIRHAIADERITAAEARVARAVNAVRPGVRFGHLLDAARSLHSKGIMSHQIRTNYRAAGITYDLVDAAVRAAAAPDFSGAALLNSIAHPRG